jgi:8-oxo-dGTP pyrophosphatase MutT (NUDIX family)
MALAQKKALTVILWRDPKQMGVQRVLLLKRPAKDGDFWQPVTGHVEKEEGYVEAAIREAEEETGLEFPHQPYFLGLEQDFEGRWGRAKERAYSLVVKNNGSAPPTPKLSEEHEDFAWLTA